MTSTNGVTPVEDYSQPESEASPEPMLSAYSLDYWREMTERQIERLRARVKQLEDEAAPLRMQISALVSALQATGKFSAAPVTLTRARRGTSTNPSSLAKKDYNHQGEDITADERGVVESMVRAGKSVTEVRAVLPHVKPGQVYARVQTVRNRMASEASR